MMRANNLMTNNLIGLNPNIKSCLYNCSGSHIRKSPLFLQTFNTGKEENHQYSSVTQHTYKHSFLSYYYKGLNKNISRGIEGYICVSGGVPNRVKMEIPTEKLSINAELEFQRKKLFGLGLNMGRITI